MKFFSQRYKEQLNDISSHEYFFNTVNFYLKKELSEIIVEFNEVFEESANRFSNETKNVYAADKVNKQLEKTYHRDVLETSFDYSELTEHLMCENTPLIFDVIECFYSVLSDDIRIEFSSKINETFEEYDSPWRICSGIMIKIDSRQFEFDLKNKAMEEFKKLAEISPNFQTSYKELCTAFDFYNNENYTDAIVNANKSYESALKVFTNINDKTAGVLISNLKDKVDLPISLEFDDFNKKVLNSLPTIRNKVAAHGGGKENIVISKNLANLAINLACSLTTFIIEEYKKGINNG